MIDVQKLAMKLRLDESVNILFSAVNRSKECKPTEEGLAALLARLKELRKGQVPAAETLLSGDRESLTTTQVRIIFKRWFRNSEFDKFAKCFANMASRAETTERFDRLTRWAERFRTMTVGAEEVDEYEEEERLAIQEFMCDESEEDPVPVEDAGEPELWF